MKKLIIHDYPSYAINEYGEIVNVVTGKQLKPLKTDRGYYRVDLFNNSNRKTIFIHKLVISHFGPPKKDGQQVNHKDGNKSNNHINNLEWCSPKENTQHAIRNGLWNSSNGKSHNSKLTEEKVRQIRNRLKNGDSHSTIANDFGIYKNAIYKISKGVSWGWLK